jgi:hypothetical protein
VSTVCSVGGKTAENRWRISKNIRILAKYWIFSISTVTGAIVARWLSIRLPGAGSALAPKFWYFGDSGVFAQVLVFLPFGTIFVYFAILGQACAEACRCIW